MVMGYVITYRDEKGSLDELNAENPEDVGDLVLRLRSRSLTVLDVVAASDPASLDIDLTSGRRTKEP
jgi:hypothetical protein